MRIRGSGKFVSIAASNTDLDNLFSTALTGVTFGVGSSKYCQISSKYELDVMTMTITGTALCFEPGTENGNLYMGFNTLPILRVNGYTGYTGDLMVLSNAEVNEVTGMASLGYTSHSWKSGLLVT